jgi:hypothetical protein
MLITFSVRQVEFLLSNFFPQDKNQSSAERKQKTFGNPAKEELLEVSSKKSDDVIEKKRSTIGFTELIACYSF